MTRPNPYWPQAFALALLMSTEAHARNFGGGVTLASEYTDNALRSSYQPQIGERQDQFQLDAFTDYENDYGKLDANYAGIYNSFSESSQIDRTTLTGNGQLQFGKNTQPFNLLLSHARRSLLNQPDQVALLRNTDEQTTTSINPTVRWRLSAVDSLLASADHSIIDYKFAAQQNSERDTGSAQWQHAFSKIQTLQMLAQHTKVTYGAFNNAEYIYQLASATYSAKLSRLDYSLNAGYNSTESTLNGNNSSPSYGIDMVYHADLGLLSLKLNQVITDTSMGSSNVGAGAIPYGTAAVGQGFDQINQRSAQLNWVTRILCERCSFDLSSSLSKSDYFTLPVDTNQQTQRAVLSYNLSRTADLRLGAQIQALHYRVAADEHGYDSQSFDVQYSKHFNHDISANLTARFEQRSSQQALYNYDASQIGFSLRQQY